MHEASTFVFFEVSTIVFFHVLSMRSKRLASSGSCWRMSSEPMKMDSRYIQRRCTCIQISSTSPMSERSASQPLTSSKKGLTNLLPIMLCRLSPMSSSSSVISSVDLRIQPRSSAPFLYLNRSKCCSAHTPAIFSISFSMVSSLMAAPVISPISAAIVCSCISNKLPSVNVLGSISKCLPVFSMSWSQWRGRKASFLRSWMSGSDSWNSRMRASTATYALRSVRCLSLRSRAVSSSARAMTRPMSSSAHSILDELATDSTWSR